MKTQTLLVALIAVLAVLTFNFVAADNANSVVSGEATVSIDGININFGDFDSSTLATFAGETVPVRVYFTAADTAKDVKVEVEFTSGSADYSDSYFVGNIVNDGRLYRTGVMNVEIPAKLTDLTKDLYLRVIVTADGFQSYLAEYLISAQRNPYQLDVVSMDFDDSVSAGDSVPVSVVVRNRGFEDSEDGFVVITVPELGISAKAYFGDLSALETCEDDCDNVDSIQKVLTLKIPASAKDGVYDLVAKVYDDESVTTVKDSIKVSASSATQIVAPVKSQNVKAGETKTFDLILVNSADKVAVYELKAVSGSDLIVSVPAVITVDAGSSKTVQVTVTVSEDAQKGAYPFTVEANGQSTVLTANVSGKSVSASAIALTIVLVIVFVVLLAVLIVLLTRKDKPAADEVETSYY